MNGLCRSPPTRRHECRSSSRVLLKEVLEVHAGGCKEVLMFGAEVRVVGAGKYQVLLILYLLAHAMWTSALLSRNALSISPPRPSPRLHRQPMRSSTQLCQARHAESAIELLHVLWRLVLVDCDAAAANVGPIVL
jgi:hypothetical protein